MTSARHRLPPPRAQVTCLAEPLPKIRAYIPETEFVKSVFDEFEAVVAGAPSLAGLIEAALYTFVDLESGVESAINIVKQLKKFPDATALKKAGEQAVKFVTAAADFRADLTGLASALVRAADSFFTPIGATSTSSVCKALASVIQWGLSALDAAVKMVMEHLPVVLVGLPAWSEPADTRYLDGPGIGWDALPAMCTAPYCALRAARCRRPSPACPAVSAAPFAPRRHASRATRSPACYTAPPQPFVGLLCALFFSSLVRGRPGDTLKNFNLAKAEELATKLGDPKALALYVTDQVRSAKGTARCFAGGGRGSGRTLAVA